MAERRRASTNTTSLSRSMIPLVIYESRMRPCPQKISGLGLSGPQKILEPMTITNTITYGAYYNMSADIYTISVTVPRPGSQAVVLDFKYDHRQP